MRTKARSFGRSSLLALLVILDLVWACLCAAFGGTILHFVAQLVGGTGSAVETGTIVGGVIGFFMGLISGAVVMIVIGLALLVFAVLFGTKKR
jgi:hypothetical protein